MDSGAAAAKAKEAGNDELIIRKANECMAAAQFYGRRSMIFDEFWRDGELALLFGPPGVGKSVLATLIAENAARGRVIDGFRMMPHRQKVLYVDLKLSDEQFATRYSGDMKRYKFSGNFSRISCEWRKDLGGKIKQAVLKCGARLVIIDDLSAVCQSYGGTRETLPFMRELRRLKNALDVSILVLSSCETPGPRHFVNEVDLRRSRILCDVADSVIAMCQLPGTIDSCIFQTRSRNARVHWTTVNSPVCRITRQDDGKFLEMIFDDRFIARMSDEEIELVRAVKAARDAGRPWAALAEELGISKTRATRLFEKWSPRMEPPAPVEPAPAEPKYGLLPCDSDDARCYDSKQYERDTGLFILRNPAPAPVEAAQPVAEPPPKPEMDVSKIPFAAAFKRRTLNDLELSVDGYGKDIWVEDAMSITACQSYITGSTGLGMLCDLSEKHLASMPRASARPRTSTAGWRGSER